MKRKHTVFAWLVGSVGALSLLLAYPVGNTVKLERQRRQVERILHESLTVGQGRSEAEAILKAKGMGVHYSETPTIDLSHGSTYFEPTLITFQGAMRVNAEYWFDGSGKLIRWKVGLDSYP